MHVPNLPEWLCHKRVLAAKIYAIQPVDFQNSIRLSLEIGPDVRDYVDVSREWADKHKPAIGGYYVKYNDDYESYSPAKAFEDGYRRGIFPMTCVRFEGVRILTAPQWVGVDMAGDLQWTPEEEEAMRAIGTRPNEKAVDPWPAAHYGHDCKVVTDWDVAMGIDIDAVHKKVTENDALSNSASGSEHHTIMPSVESWVGPTKLPADFELPQDWIVMAKERAPNWTNDQIKHIFSGFREYYVKAGVMSSNWRHMWRRYIARWPYEKV